MLPINHLSHFVFNDLELPAINEMFRADKNSTVTVASAKKC